MKISAQTRSSLAFLPFMLIGSALFLVLTMTWILVAGIISVVAVGAVVAGRVFTKYSRREVVENPASTLIIDNDDHRNLPR